MLYQLRLHDIPLHFASENLLQNPKLFLFFSLAEGTYRQKTSIIYFIFNKMMSELYSMTSFSIPSGLTPS